MTTVTPARLPPALESALQRVRLAARAAAERSVNALGLAALSATNNAQRDALLGGQFELNRKLALFCQTFNDTLEERITRESTPRTTHSSGPSTWDTMSLVDDHEVEIKVLADRFALDIQNQCEWELRELDTYMGAVMHLRAADARPQPAAPRDPRAGHGARDRSHYRPPRGAQGAVARGRQGARQRHAPDLSRRDGRPARGRHQAAEDDACAARKARAPMSGRMRLATTSSRTAPASSTRGALTSGSGSLGNPTTSGGGFARSQRGTGVEGFASSVRGTQGIGGDTTAMTQFPATEQAGDPRSAAGRLRQRERRHVGPDRPGTDGPAAATGLHRAPRRRVGADHRRRPRSHRIDLEPRRPRGAEPDRRAPRGAAPGRDRLARSHGDRRGRQPVRPDPVRSQGAAADGAPDRAAATAGAARGARATPRSSRRAATRCAASSTASHRWPSHSTPRQRRRQGVPEAGQGPGAGDRRGRLRPDRAVRAEARRARGVHRRPEPSRGAAPGQCRRGAGAQGKPAAPAAALRRATAPWPAGHPGAGLPARLRVVGVEPGRDAGRARRRPRQPQRGAPAPGRPRPVDERAAQGLAGPAQGLPDRACRR